MPPKITPLPLNTLLRYSDPRRGNERPDPPGDVRRLARHRLLLQGRGESRTRATRTMETILAISMAVSYSQGIAAATCFDGAPPETEPLRLPPGTCWPFQSEELAANRVQLLSSFLDDMLSRPGYASHPAVLAFLEIQK